HAKAHIEYSIHLRVFDAAGALDVGKDGRHRPRRLIETGTESIRQDAWNVLLKAAAGDMRHTLDEPQGGLQIRNVAMMGAQDGIGQRLTELGLVPLETGAVRYGAIVVHGDVEGTSRKGVTVRVKAIGGQPEQEVTGHDSGAVDDLVSLHRTNDEAYEIELTRRVHPRHVGRLTAEECTVQRRTRIGDALDDGDLRVGRQLEAADVVQKEERFRARREGIVDA